MMSPFVEVKCVEEKEISQTPSENIAKTNKVEIDNQLKKVIEKKNSELNGVITGIDGESTCGGTTVSSAGGSSGSANGCCDEILKTTSSAGDSGSNTDCCNTGTSSQPTVTRSAGTNTNNCDSGPTQCECECPSCQSGKVGECCCFCKDSTHDTADNNSKKCLGNLVGLLSNKDIKCNAGNSNCLMCYLCLLKCSIKKLKEACTVNNGAANGDLNETLGKLPTHISAVVDNILGTTSPQCCKKCTCQSSETGTCTCDSGDCCKVNNRFSGFTKFLLGTCSTSSETNSNNNNCKTITDTLTQLNGTLKAFLENSASGSTSGCPCCNGEGTDTCTNRCCCGLTNCNKNGCQGTQPIKMLSCVIECGLKAIKERSEKIVQHIDKIEECLKCIDKKMNSLKGEYDNLHNCISELGKCVEKETDCLRNKICKLAKAKEDNQKKFKDVINTSKEVLSDICGY